MGNLCCTNNQTPELNIQDGRTDVNQREKVRANLTPKENDVNEVQPEVSKQQLQEQEKAQQHDFPSAELGKSARQRVQQVQPALIAVIDTIYEIQALINSIFDPTEQLVQIKEYINNVQILLNSLNLYWVGLYEVYQKESVEFIQSAFLKLKAFNEYLNQQFQHAKTLERKEGQTEWTSFSELFSQKAVIDHINATFINDLKKYHEQFRGYNTVRTQLNPKTAQKFKFALQGIEKDILSSFSSAYVRFHSKNHLGYTLWDQMFNGSLFVPREVFIQKYSQKCNVDPSKLRFITYLLNSFSETINYFDFFDVINNTPENFNDEGVILNGKIREIEELIEKSGEQKAQVPEKVDDNTSKFQNGAIFKGKLVNNLFDGQGTLAFPHYFAQGTFVNGKLNGAGKVTHYDVVQEGNFVEGLLQGEGKITYPDGTEFVGLFQNNFYHGQGTLTTFNNIQISGEWTEGKIIKGRIVYPNQEVYEGEILNNRYRHGEGVQTNQKKQLIFKGKFQYDEFANGHLYKSGSADHIYHGELDSHFDTAGIFKYEGAQYNGGFNFESYWRVNQGDLTYSKIQKIDGTWVRDAPVKAVNYFDINNKNSRYEGDWKNFTRDGNGEFFYNSGDHYKGQVKNNLRHGKGVYTYKSGDKYTGDFENNIFNGHGVFSFANGDSYTGQIQNGRFHGLGKYVFAQKQTSYLGQWEADRYNGQGVCYNAQGDVIKAGVWQKDKLINDLKQDISQLKDIEAFLKENTQQAQQKQANQQIVAPQQQPTQAGQAGQAQQPQAQQAQQAQVADNQAQKGDKAVEQKQVNNQQQQVAAPTKQEQAVDQQQAANKDNNTQKQQVAEPQQLQQPQQQQQQQAPVTQQQSSKEQVDPRKQEAQPFKQDQSKEPIKN